MSIEKCVRRENNSSSDEDEPLSSYRPPGPSSVQEKTSTGEAQLLAQYTARRDAQIKNDKTAKKSSGDNTQPAQKGQRTEAEAAVLPGCDGESIALKHLQAEKKKREVLSAEKIIAETKHKTLQKTLEAERKDHLLLKNKVTMLEDEKMELTEALEAAKKKRLMLEAMHKQV